MRLKRESRFILRLCVNKVECMTNLKFQSLLILPETKDSNANSCGTSHAAVDEALLLEDFSLIRHGVHENASKHESDKGENRRKKATKNMNSIERLMTESDGDALSFRMGPFDLQIKKVPIQIKTFMFKICNKSIMTITFPISGELHRNLWLCW